ncbi:unnamed protein product [Porites evermanni]|uniref:G-protein coupled receptors family 1 profile domain-containing protein n=1 Tax=Porites evermanni TaxID=104178 RepID=A0ABN8SMG5_9CNID|nr:unnamed protein product [Porites evermanni]
MIFSSSECVTWLSLGMIESAVIIAGNLISIILFMKNNCLRKRGLFLVINLTVADMLAGGSFIADLFFTLNSSYCKFSELNLGSYWRTVPLNFAILFFPLASLTNIAMISLQQTHATFRPFQHRVIKKWVYGVAIAFVWVLAATVSATVVSFKLSTNSRSHYFYLWQSYNCLCLFVICVSYTSTVVKFCCGARPPHHGAARRQRKLTVTLLLMTVVSLLMWLPYVVATFVNFRTNHVKSLSVPKQFRLNIALIFLYNANSLVNPILYAIRMPEFRRALLSLFRRQQNQMIGNILLRRL